VPVPDFDLLMVQIGDKMKIEPIDDTIEKRAAERARRYRDQLITLDTTAYPEARRILRGAFERAGGTLAWMEKINTEVSTARRKQIFEHALEQYPNDLELQIRHAEFLGRHSLDLGSCRAGLEQLRGHDRELQYRPTQLLAELHFLEGRIGDAVVLLMSLPFPWTVRANALSAQISEVTGDFASAESVFPLVGEQAFARFLFRQRRVDECLAIVENHLGDPAWAVFAAYAQWVGRKDPVGARRMLAEQADLESIDYQQSFASATFALLADDLDAAKVAIARLDSMPKLDWWDETAVAVLGLFHALHRGSIDEHRLQTIRQLFATCSYVRMPMVQILLELAEALRPKLPKQYRKFAIELVRAFYDPELRTGLNVYEQWRKAAD
jgi:hypothetical protein